MSNMAQSVKQQYVYAAAASMSDLRCGDQVDVEWDGEWFAGVVTDVPTPNDLAVSYTNGDFEDSVPKNVARLRSFPKRVLPGDEKKGKRKDPQTKLRNGANSGDIGLVMEALREGANPRLMDEIGYLPLHWAAGPDEGMPGDTISRRACIALLARLSDKDACDRTSHGMRGVQHAVARNLVGCVKTFHHVGADMQSTVHWAVSQKAHGVLRELLRLGVPINTNKLEWDGCSPLMLAASGNDTYGIQLLADHVRSRHGEGSVLSMLHEAQHGKLRATALHYAADAAADAVVTLLLELKASPSARNAQGATAAVLARTRAHAAAEGATEEIYQAAVRCAELLEAAISAEKEARRVAGYDSAGSPKGKRKGKKVAHDALSAYDSAAAASAASGADEPEEMVEQAAHKQPNESHAAAAIGAATVGTGAYTSGEATGEQSEDEAGLIREQREFLIREQSKFLIREQREFLIREQSEDEAGLIREQSEDEAGRMGEQSEAAQGMDGAGDEGAEDSGDELDDDAHTPPLDYTIDAAAAALLRQGIFGFPAAATAAPAAGAAAAFAPQPPVASVDEAMNEAVNQSVAEAVAAADGDEAAVWGHMWGGLSSPVSTLRRHAAALRAAAGADGVPPSVAAPTPPAAQPAAAASSSSGGDGSSIGGDEEWVVYVAAAYTSLWAVDGEEVDGDEGEGPALDGAADEEPADEDGVEDEDDKDVEVGLGDEDEEDDVLMMEV